MRSESKLSWWRELGAVSQGMLFLDGHITRPELPQPHVHGARCHHRADLHQRAVQVLAARQRRQMMALSLFR